MVARKSDAVHDEIVTLHPRVHVYSDPEGRDCAKHLVCFGSGFRRSGRLTTAVLYGCQSATEFRDLERQHLSRPSQTQAFAMQYIRSYAWMRPMLRSPQSSVSYTLFRKEVKSCFCAAQGEYLAEA